MKTLIERLIKCGHSQERAKAIVNEAQNSSNPNYILFYYGIKNLPEYLPWKEDFAHAMNCAEEIIKKRKAIK